MGSKPRGISASRGAAVLGVSEWQTPFEVWQRIMEEREPGFNERNGYTLPAEPDSAAIRWGTAFEGAVIALAERELGCHIAHRETFFTINEYPDDPIFERTINEEGSPNFITCHIDGLYMDKRSTGVLHEGKTTSAFAFREKWGKPGTDLIPRIYQVQTQHQMLCAGASEVIVSVLVFPETPDKWEAAGWQVKNPHNKGDWGITRFTNESSPTPTIQWASVLADMGYFYQYRVKAKENIQRQLVKEYREFWIRYVLTGKPPEPRNYEDIKRLCPEPKSTIIVPDYIERRILEYKGITEETASAKKQKERNKMIITKYAATHAGIKDDESTEAVIFRNTSGDKLGSWSRNKNGSFIFRC